MAEYKIIFELKYSVHYPLIVEAENLNDAVNKASRYSNMANKGREIIGIELVTRLYCPCSYCGTEQIEGIGCTNIYCEHSHGR